VSEAAALASGVKARERGAIARAITLLESRRPEHAAAAEELLAELYPESGRAVRIGVTGAPGVGKSTLVDALGAHALSTRRRVGVLAIDPTSAVRGGSLLGDRLRMARLGASEQAFVRASPSGGAEGGLGRRTREGLIVLDAAGFDMILLESVGVGQGELAVTEAVDVVLAVAIAGAGDDVQGMKRGLLEHADVVVFNKCDGPNAAQVERARDELAGLFAWMRPEARVLAVSSLEGSSVPELFEELLRRHRELEQSGELFSRRERQRCRWFEAALRERLLERLRADPALEAERRLLEQSVADGRIVPPRAARLLLERR
jgi:LAO/AO transport system kinase